MSLKANWTGDQNTFPTESEPKTVKVEPQPTEIPLQIIAGIVATVILVAIAIYFVKIRRHK